MNYLDASIRSVKLQKTNPKFQKRKNDAGIGELNLKRLK